MGAALPADGSEQGGAGLVVEGDDDAGGREIFAIHQQCAPRKERCETHVRPSGAEQT